MPKNSTKTKKFRNKTIKMIIFFCRYNMIMLIYQSMFRNILYSLMKSYNLEEITLKSMQNRDKLKLLEEMVLKLTDNPHVNLITKIEILLTKYLVQPPTRGVLTNWVYQRTDVPEWVMYIFENELRKTKQDKDNTIDLIDKIDALQNTLSEMSKELTQIKSHYRGGSVKNSDGGDDADINRLRGVFEAYGITQDTYTNSKGELRYIAHQIPVSDYRGAWVEFEVFLNNVIENNYTNVSLNMIPDILDAFDAENLDFDDPEREKAQNDRVAWCKAHKIPPLMF